MRECSSYCETQRESRRESSAGQSSLLRRRPEPFAGDAGRRSASAVRALQSVTLLLLAVLLVPSAWAKQHDKPDLKLTAALDESAPEQQPILVIGIINQSGHTLRIPEPPLLCKPAPGALSLEVKFVSEGANRQEKPVDCDLEVDPSSLPDIRERAKQWRVLKDGEVYQVRRPLAMGVDANAPGTYEMRVIYDGPSANSDETEKLKSAGIEAPIGRFQSAKLTYKVNKPKE